MSNQPDNTSQSRRFDEHIAANLRLQAEAIKRRLDYQEAQRLLGQQPKPVYGES